MQLDYINMRELINIRIKQIDEASKENPYFNKEHIELMGIYNSLSALIVLERKSVEHYNDNYGEVPLKVVV